MAPDANVVYVGAASCADPDLADALALIVDNHLASIVSDSWGEPADHVHARSPSTTRSSRPARPRASASSSPPATPATRTRSRTQARTCSQVDFPTSSPYVTSVGGTSLAIGRSDNYEFETSWGTLLDPLAANGMSWTYTPPGVYPDGLRRLQRRRRELPCSPSRPTRRAWCRTAWPPRCPTARPARVPMRVMPDVSALADPSTGIPGRPDHAAAGRHDLRVLAQPDRRHQRRLPDLRRHRGGRAAGGRASARLRQPGDLPAVRHVGVP